MTNMVDEGIIKCVQYWPEDVGTEEEYGEVLVSLSDIQVFTHFSIYGMKLRRKHDLSAHR